MQPDPDYIAARNKLIPEAEKWTNQLCGKKYKGTSEKEKAVWDARWSRNFIRRMNFLYEEEQCQP